MNTGIRLDRLVVLRGMAPSRMRAVEAIEGSGIRVDGAVVHRAAAQVAEAFAGMGGDFNVSVDLDVTSLLTEVLAERTPEAIRLVAEIAQRHGGSVQAFATKPQGLVVRVVLPLG